MLWHLLRANPGDVVAFEELGDVSRAGGSETLSEEDKSGLAHNPISDGSPSLWKTFANWVAARQDGTLPEGCKYILYVAQPYDGAWVQRLSDCESAPEADKLVRKLRKEMKSKLEQPGEDGVGEALQAQLIRLFSHSDKLIASIVTDFTLEKAESSPIEDVELELSRGVADNHVHDLTDSLLGWVKTRLMKQIKKGEPARIPYNDFRKQRLNVTQRIAGRLIAFPESQIDVTSEQIAAQFVDSTYVRQLNLLQLNNDEIEVHVNHFLRASAQRVIWSEDGFLNKTNIERYEADLVDMWKLSRSHIQRTKSEASPVVRGVEILFRCLDGRAQVESVPVPAFFLHGSFHAIANEPRIGWHPDWEGLLNAERKEGG